MIRTQHPRGVLAETASNEVHEHEEGLAALRETTGPHSAQYDCFFLAFLILFFRGESGARVFIYLMIPGLSFLPHFLFFAVGGMKVSVSHTQFEHA